MLRRTVFMLLIAVALVAALLVSQRRVGPLQVSGFLEADEVRVGSRVGGRVARVLVEEGQRVSAGDALVELEPFDLAEREAEARAELHAREGELARLEAGYLAEEVAGARAREQQARARLERLENGPRPQEVETARADLRLAEAELELARAEYERAKVLEADAFASKNTLDQALASQRVAAATVDARQETLDLLVEGTRAEDLAQARAELAEASAALALLERGYREEDIAVARSSVAAARATLEAQQRRSEELVVSAPLDAVVEAVRLRPGDLVAPDAPVLSLLDTSRLWVRAYVPQGSLRLEPQQLVEVEIDAYPGRSFRARIGFIADQAEFTPRNVQTPEERVDQVFRIKAYLEEGLDVLRPGMAADVILERTPAEAAR